MPFVESFSVSQNSNSINILTLTDTSTGSDSAIVSRAIFITTGDGTPIVPAGNTTPFIVWLLANASINLNVISQDFSLLITVNWLDINGNVLYTTGNVYLFTAYTEQFIYGLTQEQAANPSIVQDTNYYNNKQQLRVLVDSAVNAVAIASDQMAAQSCLNQAAYMISQKNLFF